MFSRKAQSAWEVIEKSKRKHEHYCFRFGKVLGKWTKIKKQARNVFCKVKMLLAQSEQCMKSARKWKANTKHVLLGLEKCLTSQRKLKNQAWTLFLKSENDFRLAYVAFAPGANCVWLSFVCKKLAAPWGLPRRSSTPVLTGPCAAWLRKAEEIRCIRRGMAASVCRRQGCVLVVC